MDHRPYARRGDYRGGMVETYAAQLDRTQAITVIRKGRYT